MTPGCCETSTDLRLVVSSGGPWPVWWVERPTTDGSAHRTAVVYCPFCGADLPPPPDTETGK